MTTAREEFEAYVFVARRQSLALLTGDELAGADSRQRSVRAAVGGVLIGLLAAAGCGAAALFGTTAGHPGPTPARCGAASVAQPASACTRA